MKTQIKILIPSEGFGPVDVEYRVRRATLGRHDRTLYTFTGFWPVYRGVRGKQLDTQAVISMNGQAELEEMVVEKTQSSHSAGLEADLENPGVTPTRKINFRKPKHNMPD